jgi:para-nitrobenzyl esterase
MRSNRRRFVQALGTGAAGMTISSTGFVAATSDKAGVEEDGPVLQIGDAIAVANTQHGRVRGRCDIRPTPPTTPAPPAGC